MRILTFTADSARDAIERVRAELGPDALIISLEETANGRGVVGRAAVDGIGPAPNDTDPTPADPPENRLERLLKARLSTWTASPLA